MANGALSGVLVIAHHSLDLNHALFAYRWPLRRTHYTRHRYLVFAVLRNRSLLDKCGAKGGGAD